MLKLRYYLRLASAFISRFKAILVFGVLFGIVAFMILGFFGPTFFINNKERIGYVGRYTTEDLPLPVLNLVGEGLTVISQTADPTPGLAKSWKSEEDGKVWVFYLDENKRWQDGKQVTSDSLFYSFEDVEVERPDASTLVFRLKDKFAPFPTVVARPVFKKGFLGTGEWKVINLSLVGNYVESISLEDKQKNKKLIKFYPTEDQAKTAFKLGEIDTIEDIIDPTPLNTWSTVELEEEVVFNRYVAVFFNTQDPLFANDKALRQALSYGIDKDGLGVNRAIGPVAPQSWAFNPQIKDYNFDQQRAKELLKDLPEEVKNSLAIKLTTTSVLLPVAEKIVKNWSDLGIDASVSVVTGVPNEYQAFLAIYDSPYDPDQYVIWHSSQSLTNISKFSNPRIDKLLEDGRLETDKQERRKIYLDFQRFLLEESPAAFLYHPVSYTIKRK